MSDEILEMEERIALRNARGHETIHDDIMMLLVREIRELRMAYMAVIERLNQ